MVCSSECFRRPCFILNQYHQSKISDDIIKIISKELNFNGNVFDIFELSMKNKNNHLKIIKKGKFDEYRDIHEEEMNSSINKNSGELPVHKLLQQLSLDDLLWDYDAVSLYPSAMWDENSIYPRIETRYAYTEDMNDELVKKFNSGNFNQGTAISKMKYYNPKNLTAQHLLVKEREKKIQINRMRSGYFIQTLTSVDIQEFCKIGSKRIQIYEGVIYREDCKVSRFGKAIYKLFTVTISRFF